MKKYHGERTALGASVTVDGVLLNPRNDLYNHSPDGFEWGYGGSGPAQLALALLADHLGDDETAIKLHQDFKWAIVAGLPDEWVLNSEQIAGTVTLLLAKEPQS